MLDASEEQEIIGMAYLDLVSEADKDRIERLLRAALNGEASEFEFRANNDHDFVSSFIPNGSKRTLHTSAMRQTK